MIKNTYEIGNVKNEEKEFFRNDVIDIDFTPYPNRKMKLFRKLYSIESFVFITVQGDIPVNNINIDLVF